MVHDEKGNITGKLKQVSACGYELIDYFLLSEDVWCVEYFAPLERLVIETRIGYADDPKVLEAIDSSQLEIDMFKKNPEINNSVFFIMKRDDSN